MSKSRWFEKDNQIDPEAPLSRLPEYNQRLEFHVACRRLEEVLVAYDAVREQLAAKDAELKELKAQMEHIEEYGTDEINDAVSLRHQLTAAKGELEEAERRWRAQSKHDEDTKNMLRNQVAELTTERNGLREGYENLGRAYLKERQVREAAPMVWLVKAGDGTPVQVVERREHWDMAVGATIECVHAVPVDGEEGK
jgi:DNA repair exonuclease SbcCD ATPase subunit